MGEPPEDSSHWRTLAKEEDRQGNNNNAWHCTYSFLLSMQAIAKMLFMTFVFLQITNSQKLSVCENTQARNKERMPLGL